VARLPGRGEQPFELFVEEVAVIRSCQVVDEGAARGIHVFVCVNDFRVNNLPLDVGIVVERRNVDAHVATQLFADEELVLEDLLPVALRLLLGKPDLDKRENDVPVIRARLLADHVERALVVLDMGFNVAAGDLDPSQVGEFLEVVEIFYVS